MEHYVAGATEVAFHRDELQKFAVELGIKLPDNLGDIVYSFRYRSLLPESITKTAPDGMVWVIRPDGRSQYRLCLVKDRPIVPNPNLAVTKVPDSTPGIIAMYPGSDEQALLAKVRYNRLIDIFTGITSYSLQNHLRTAVKGLGQVEVDELYVGIDKRGVHYVFPVQAKGGRDKMSIVQIEQDIAVCSEKFPSLVCIPIGAQFIGDDKIALFSFEVGTDGSVSVLSEHHYLLVSPDELSAAELRTYRDRPQQS